MRILHIGNFFPPVTGGIESFLGDLLPALERGGVKTAALVYDDILVLENLEALRVDMHQWRQTS